MQEGCDLEAFCTFEQQLIFTRLLRYFSNWLTASFTVFLYSQKSQSASGRERQLDSVFSNLLQQLGSRHRFTGGPLCGLENIHFSVLREYDQLAWRKPILLADPNWTLLLMFSADYFRELGETYCLAGTTCHE